MGKAIVIPGLVVSNPLMTVTFEGVESVLAKYYAANSTINATEKAALETFVGELIDSGLWSKVQYFYPMLGNSVADMLLDVVDPDTEDILAAQSTDGLSVSSRKLRTSATRTTILNASLTMRFADSIDAANLSIIHAVNLQTVDSAQYAGETIMARSDVYVSAGVGLGVYSGGWRNPRMAAGPNGQSGNYVPSTGPSNCTSYVERIDCADYNGNAATLYKDKEVYAEGTNYNTGKYATWYLREPCLSASAGAADFGGLILTKHLTASEWASVHDLFLAYLQAVSKHS